MKSSLANFLKMASFHHLDNDYSKPIDECELQIRVPLSIGDFRNGIFDIAAKVVK